MHAAGTETPGGRSSKRLREDVCETTDGRSSSERLRSELLAAAERGDEAAAAALEEQLYAFLDDRGLRYDEG